MNAAKALGLWNLASLNFTVSDPGNVSVAFLKLQPTSVQNVAICGLRISSWRPLSRAITIDSDKPSRMLPTPLVLADESYSRTGRRFPWRLEIAVLQAAEAADFFWNSANKESPAGSSSTVSESFFRLSTEDECDGGVLGSCSDTAAQYLIISA